MKQNMKWVKQMKTILVNKVNNKLPFQLEIFQLTKAENGYLKEFIKGVLV